MSNFRIPPHPLGRRTFIKGLTLGAAAVGGAAFLAACNDASGSGSAASGGDGETITFIKYLEGGYNEQVGIGFAAAAAQLGLNSTSGNGKGDANVQLQAFNQGLVKKAKGIAINPADGVNVDNLARQAEAAGVYVQASFSVPPWFTPWATTDNYTYLSPDDYTGAYRVTEVLAKKLNGQGRILRVRGPQSNTTDVNRGAANDAVLAQYPGIAVVGELYTDWTPEEGQTATSSLLARYPDVVAIIAADDGIATGAVSAVKAIGKQPGKDILVTGVNGADEAVARIKEGTQLATASNLPSFHGFAMAAQLYDRINGWTPTPGERMLGWEPITVTADNVDKYIETYLDRPIDQHFDARRLSRIITPDTWDTTLALYPLKPETVWAGTNKPSGFTFPTGYDHALADGSFETTTALYAAHANAGALGSGN